MIRSTKNIIVSDAEGNIIRRFASVKDAAAAYNVSTSTITYWIKSDVLRNGQAFDYDPEQESRKAFDEPKKVKKKKEVAVVEKPKVELDRENNIIYKYETIGTRVCITPCPHRINPKPTIGSVQCQCCSRFEGMDRDTHEVACRKVTINLMKQYD
jgi:hypothetical protein